MADATQENREVQDKLRSVVNHLKTFDNCQQCEKYLRNKINEEQNRIIMIVSGQLGQQIIGNIHQLKQVISIFVFCFDKERNELWASKYKKVRGVIVKLYKLLEQIEIDCKSDEQKLNRPIEVLSDNDDIIPTLLQNNYSLIDRRHFLKKCLQEYQNNLSGIENIQEFEHLYSSSNALNHFSNETFLYRLLMKSLQVFDIDTLFLLRFFLQDIEQQLTSCPTVSVPVYFGQLMTDDQIELMLNSINGNALHFNSYIIAKTKQEQVIKSLQNSANKDSLNCVLFNIETNEIGKEFSQFVLFPITTQFHIISMNFQNDMYIVKVIVLKSSSCSNTLKQNSIELVHRLRNLGRFDDAEKLLNRLLIQYPSKNSQFYEALARIAQDKGLYEKSVQLYEKSFVKISERDQSHCYNNIGCVYDYVNQYEAAIKFYSKALDTQKNNIDQAMFLNNIGIALAHQEQYQKALEYFQQSLIIRKESLSTNHPDLGISYVNIGAVYSSINQLDRALEYYQNALKIFSQQPSHKFNGIVYQNMANIFDKMNKLNESLQYYEKAVTIFRQTRPPNNPDLIDLEQIIKQFK